MELVTTERDSVDAQARLDEVRLENLAEGRELVDTAEDNTQFARGLILRMRVLAVGASWETIAEYERFGLQQEFLGLTRELDRLAETSEYNGDRVASGEVETMGVSIGGGAEEIIEVSLPNLTALTLGVDSSAIDLTTASSASAAITGIDLASATASLAGVALLTAEDALELAQERFAAP